MKKPVETMLSTGRRMTKSRMIAAAAMVAPKTANPACAVLGMSTNVPPTISTTPVKYLNHCPIPIS
jgi:hypothetical protein